MSRGIIGITSAGVMIFAALVAVPAYATINIEMVTVGDPGNPGELSGNGYGLLERICGGVNYTYQIGKFEITNAQYIAFLNSVARYEDTYHLYDANMSDTYGGIRRTGSGTGSDPYIYSVKNNDPNWYNRPVNYTYHSDCMRFVNWLQNGQPEGNEVAGVTETGTYTFSDATTVTIPDHSTFTTPHYVLPNEDEWYKAAYYKGGDSNARYWDYATQSNIAPDNNPPWLDSGNSANYYFYDSSDPNNSHYAVGPIYYTTEVGSYTLSESAYGTHDQNGNLSEMVENQGDFFIGIRGDNFMSWTVSANYRMGISGLYPDLSTIGFRVALVPEPGTIFYSFWFASIILFRRRTKN